MNNTIQILDTFGKKILEFDFNKKDKYKLSNEFAEYYMIPKHARTYKEFVIWIKEARPNWTINENGTFILGSKNEHKRHKGPQF